MNASFTIQTKELKAALSAMSRIGSKFNQATVLKISVLPDIIEIATQGITRMMKAQTVGLADIIIPALLLKGYANTTKTVTIQFSFKPGELRCGSSIYSSPSIKLETVFNVPENDLPINASRMEILRQNAKKSQEEIERFNLTPAIANDNLFVRSKIEKALKYLKEFEVTSDDLFSLIQKKIRK